jgi:hypothetical protein
MLTLRPTGLSSPAYRSWLDYVIVEDGRGRGAALRRPAQQAEISLVLVDYGLC